VNGLSLGQVGIKSNAYGRIGKLWGVLFSGVVENLWGAKTALRSWGGEVTAISERICKDDWFSDERVPPDSCEHAYVKRGARKGRFVREGSKFRKRVGVNQAFGWSLEKSFP